MKRILILILLALAWVAYCEAQTVVKVGQAEYATGYLMSDSTVRVASQQAYTPAMATFSPDSIIGIGDGQYGFPIWDVQGKVWTCFAPSGFAINANLVGNDENGNPFTENKIVKGWFQAYVSIRGADSSSVWIWGIGDPLNINGGATISAPIELENPRNKHFVDLYCVSNTGFSSLTKAVLLCSDGTIEVYTRGSATPTEIAISGKTIVKICAVGYYGFGAYTSDNLFYVWGGFNSTYLGASSHSTTPTDITSNWDAVGAVHPWKEIVGNSHSLKVVDANNQLFVSGANSMGNLGIGSEHTPMRTLPSPYQIDIDENNYMVVGPTKVNGAKVQNVQGGQTVCFYWFAQDLSGNWYSCGRDKTMSLGDGVTLPAYGGDGYDDYPNAADWPALKNVAPHLLGTWTVQENFSPNDSLPPFVSANVNQPDVHATSTTLGPLVVLPFAYKAYCS